MKIYDISIPLNDKTPVWEGDSGVIISHTDRITAGAEFNVSRLNMGVHVGTHIDSPRHLFNNGISVDQIDLNNLIGPVQVIKIPNEVTQIEPHHLMASGFKNNKKRTLLKTCNSRIWESDHCSFQKSYSSITEECAEFFAENKMLLVGIDYFSISPYENLKPVHEILLRNGITILENVDLSKIEPGMYNLICLPIKITNTDGAPVRAVLTRG